MEATALSCGPAQGSAPTKGAEEGQRTIAPAVDPFLVEALENPRHRLTVLRMELDIQKFMQNNDLHQFEFQQLPTSYLRCAAHRVAQHYGMQTMAQDIATDGFGSRVCAKKTAESKFPVIHLSEIPFKQPEGGKTEQVKIVIRARPNQAVCDAAEAGNSRRLLRTVEERIEEYDKARARIFSAPSSPEVVSPSSMDAADRKRLCSIRDEKEFDRIVPSVDALDNIGTKDGTSVAIFRDMEKDRNDPDYDRSYDRYARGFLPSHGHNLGSHNVIPQPTFLQYEAGFTQLAQFPRAQASVSYMPSNVMTPFCAVGCNQTSPNAVYMQWPNPAMVYAHSYDHFRHAVYPVSHISCDVLLGFCTEKCQRYFNRQKTRITAKPQFLPCIH